MNKFALILSGCGVFDGTEIHEAVLAMYAIARLGATYETYAPDVDQHHVINHLTGESTDEQRNVLVESARIARGKIFPLSDFDPEKVDGLLLPGGFGAAKNLSDWAFQGSNAVVNEELSTAVKGMVELGKPIGALCIAPVVVARILGNVQVTIGDDSGTIDALRALGAEHVETTHGEVVVDENYNVVTTPCYMLDATIDQIGEGAENVVRAMLDMMNS